jgi:hypothetical protein
MEIVKAAFIDSLILEACVGYSYWDWDCSFTALGIVLPSRSRDFRN